MTGDRGGDPEAVADVLAALADPTRRRLLEMLAAAGEVTATTLAGRLPVSRQAIVKHLAVLNAAGLVAGSRVGREVRYGVRPAALGAAAQWIAALAADWDRRLAAVKRAAEADDGADGAGDGIGGVVGVGIGGEAGVDAEPDGAGK